MRNQPKAQRDPQREVPPHQCARCGGGIYPGAAYWRVNGRVFCEGCLLAWAMEQLSCFRHICGEVRE